MMATRCLCIGICFDLPGRFVFLGQAPGHSVTLNTVENHIEQSVEFQLNCPPDLPAEQGEPGPPRGRLPQPPGQGQGGVHHRRVQEDRPFQKCEFSKLCPSEKIQRLTPKTLILQDRRNNTGSAIRPQTSCLMMTSSTVNEPSWVQTQILCQPTVLY